MGTDYEKIINCIKPDLDNFVVFSASLFQDNNEMESILKNYLSNRGKLIRPVLVFLFTRAAGIVPEQKHFLLSFCVEILHNASLIHDDIIDNSKKRRGKQTLHTAFDSRLAVLAGDYLLSKAIEALSKIKNTEIIDIQTKFIKKLITGEVNQYFSRYNAASIDDYIKKSENKTASLFQAAVQSVSILNNTPDYSEFARNFGIAFQIHNDLQNFNTVEKISEDMNNGVYTAPVIFYFQKNNITNIKNIDDFFNSPQRELFLEKTRHLIEKFSNMAIENIACLEDNQYKEALIRLCKLYARG